MQIGYIHSIETFGSVDGPGVRFIVFMQGCPMRCQYCHNPDSWKTRVGEQTTTDELLEKALRYRSYWGDKGGITVSGGEALMQMEFVTELFEKAHAMGINTCLDSSAQPFTRKSPWFDNFQKLMAVTDTILLDIKHIDDAEHKKLTGASNKNILAFAQFLSEKQIPVWIRHVVVKDITLNEKYLKELGCFLKTMKNIKALDILPYHNMAIPKYEALGINYPLKNTPPTTKEEAIWARDIILQNMR